MAIKICKEDGHIECDEFIEGDFHGFGKDGKVYGVEFIEYDEHDIQVGKDGEFRLNEMIEEELIYGTTI